MTDFDHEWFGMPRPFSLDDYGVSVNTDIHDGTFVVLSCTTCRPRVRIKVWSDVPTLAMVHSEARDHHTGKHRHA